MQHTLWWMFSLLSCLFLQHIVLSEPLYIVMIIIKQLVSCRINQLDTVYFHYIKIKPSSYSISKDYGVDVTGFPIQWILLPCSYCPLLCCNKCLFEFLLYHDMISLCLLPAVCVKVNAHHKYPDKTWIQLNHTDTENQYINPYRGHILPSRSRDHGSDYKCRI